MVDTMTATKVVGAGCGALLVLLLSNWASETLYHVESHGSPVAEIAMVNSIGSDGAAEEIEEVDFAVLLAEADSNKGEKVFAKCKACHIVDEPKNGAGPHLVGIVGRTIAALEDFRYSGPMSELEGEWTAESISAFIENPRKFLPGTKMTFVGLKKPKDRADVVSYLLSFQQ